MIVGGIFEEREYFLSIRVGDFEGCRSNNREGPRLEISK